LQNYSEKVNEIVTEANNELTNEQQLNKIESDWKNQIFKLVKHMKGSEDRGTFLLANTDEIK